MGELREELEVVVVSYRQEGEDVLIEVKMGLNKVDKEP